VSRFTSREFTKLVSRSGYGVKSSIGKGSAGRKDSSAGAEHDLERSPESSFQGEKSLQISYTGKVVVSIKFYRHRLADYSRAISEKALIDALQYAGAIRGDSEKEIRLIDLGQEKVEDKSQERTELTLEYSDVDFDNLFVATGRTDGR
jgi:hypothetical protein